MITIFRRLVMMILLNSLAASFAWPGCSPYMGLASLNEVSKEHPFFNNVDDFIEVKKLANKFSASVMASWSIEVCETIFTFFYSCSGPLSLASAQQTGKYWVLSGSPAPSSYIDWLGGFDVALRDENGDMIDYLTVNNVTPQYEQCNYSYPITAFGSNSTRRTARSPDGIGEWNVPPGNSEPPTEGEDNASDPPPADAPSLQFQSDIVMGQGETAQLTLLLNQAYGQDVTINLTTVNGTAVGAVDYIEYVGSVVIPAGQTQVSVSVSSLLTGNMVDTYFFLAIESAINADVADQVAKITIVQHVMADHFSIQHSGMGVNCESSLITIKAMDASRNIKTNYLGSIQLTTSTQNGDWSLVSGNGSFTVGQADSGSAQYTFSASDLGEVQLNLSNTHVEVVNINVVDQYGVTETSSQALPQDDLDLDFQQAIFKFLYDDGQSSTQAYPEFTAYKPLNTDSGMDPILLRVITTDPNTGECVNAFNGNQSVDLAIECVNPNTCDATAASPFLINQNSINENSGSVSAYTTLSLSFDANGTVRLPNIIYQDAGRVRLHAHKVVGGSTIMGISNYLDFFPAGFCLSTNDLNSQCVGQGDVQLSSCSVFKKAGENFSPEVSAQGWQVNNDLDYCDNQAPLLSFNHPLDIQPILQAPAGGSSGYLTQNQLNLTNGASNSSLSWSEVGVIKIQMGGNDYLDNTLPSNLSDNIGRWVPAAFQVTKVTDGEFDSSHNGYTYIGEQTQTGEGTIRYLIPPQFEFSAVNSFSVPDVIQNYVGSFFRNPLLTLDMVSENLGLDGINELDITPQFYTPDYLYNTSTDQYLVSLNTQDHVYFVRDSQSQVAPFIQQTPINLIGIKDSDDISGGQLTFTPLGKELRYGRLSIDNAFGPETQALKQNLKTEYFDGDAFVVNNLDDMTPVDAGKIINLAVRDVGDISDPLSVNDTAASGVLYDQGSVQEGSWQFQWQAPIGGRYGSITFDYDAPSWLQYNWDESADALQENPQATVTFGQYRGHDKIIYWKEIVK